MEMDASLKEYQAALDAQFEERKAMILSQEEKEDFLTRLDVIFDHWRELEKQKKEECPCKKN